MWLRVRFDLARGICAKILPSRQDIMDLGKQLTANTEKGL
jgi:hypothetical protein